MRSGFWEKNRMKPSSPQVRKSPPKMIVVAAVVVVVIIVRSSNSSSSSYNSSSNVSSMLYKLYIKYCIRKYVCCAYHTFLYSTYI